MSIHIITDSGSDLEQKSLENLTILPLKVTIDGTTYRDGVDMTKDEFFAMLENSEALPSTSLAGPAEFAEVFQEIQNAGDEAIVLPVSSGVSGTCQSAMIAAQEFTNISVVDSEGVSFGQAILVRRALELVKQGISRTEIVEILEKEKKKVRFFAVLDTLKYLEKGGRLSKGAAIFGGLLGLKPILAFEDGLLGAIGKSRGLKSAYRTVTERIRSDEIDLAKPVVVGYSGSTKEKAVKYLADNPYLKEITGDRVEIAQLGSAVGTHAGPGAIIITYFVK